MNTQSILCILLINFCLHQSFSLSSLNKKIDNEHPVNPNKFYLANSEVNLTLEETCIQYDPNIPKRCLDCITGYYLTFGKCYCKPSCILCDSKGKCLKCDGNDYYLYKSTCYPIDSNKYKEKFSLVLVVFILPLIITVVSLIIILSERKLAKRNNLEKYLSKNKNFRRIMLRRLIEKKEAFAGNNKKIKGNN